MFRKESLETPSEFICPLTKKMMQDPVQLAMHFSSYEYSACVYEMFTYERKAIESYIKECKSQHDREHRNDHWDSISIFRLNSPITGKTLVFQRADEKLPELIPNTDLKIRIQEYARLLPLIKTLSKENHRLENENNELKKEIARVTGYKEPKSIVSLMEFTSSPIITSLKDFSVTKPEDDSCAYKPTHSS